MTMGDARDAEDNRLLEAQDHGQLLANYFHPVRERCFLRLRDRDAADEAAQLVFERLLREFGRGKHYKVPFRVVVWMVTEWTLRGFYPGVKQDATLPEDWDLQARGDEIAEWAERYDLARMFDGLPERQRQALELLYLEGLSHEQIAACLGIKRNAVDQALHNGHRKLAELLGA